MVTDWTSRVAFKFSFWQRFYWLTTIVIENISKGHLNVWEISKFDTHAFHVCRKQYFIKCNCFSDLQPSLIYRSIFAYSHPQRRLLREPSLSRFCIAITSSPRTCQFALNACSIFAVPRSKIESRDTDKGTPVTVECRCCPLFRHLTRPLPHVILPYTTLFGCTSQRSDPRNKQDCCFDKAIHAARHVVNCNESLRGLAETSRGPRIYAVFRIT